MNDLSGNAMMNKWRRNKCLSIIILFVLAGCATKEETAPPMMVVSADKMNVFYIGVDNPVSVSVTGVSPADLILKSNEAVVEGGDGRFIVKVGTPGVVDLEVVAKLANGEEQKMGIASFRVKLIPDPVAFFGGKRGNDIISLQELSKAESLTVAFENFDFDMKAVVESFEISMNFNGIEATMRSKGNLVSDEQKKYLAKAKVGSRIYIENIRVKLPDGTTRSVASVNLKVI